MKENRLQQARAAQEATSLILRQAGFVPPDEQSAKERRLGEALSSAPFRAVLGRLVVYYWVLRRRRLVLKVGSTKGAAR